MSNTRAIVDIWTGIILSTWNCLSPPPPAVSSLLIANFLMEKFPSASWGNSLGGGCWLSASSMHNDADPYSCTDALISFTIGFPQRDAVQIAKS
jgi:hypothetical protein